MTIYYVYELGVHSYNMDVKCTSIKIYYCKEISEIQFIPINCGNVPDLSLHCKKYSYALDVYAEMHHKYIVGYIFCS